jgi:hypothetical protein
MDKITQLRASKPETPQTQEANCGACVFWNHMDAPGGPVTIGEPRRGLCIALPPTPVPQYDKTGRVVGQAHIRPIPTELEGCGMFEPRDAS